MNVLRMGLLAGIVGCACALMVPVSFATGEAKTAPATQKKTATAPVTTTAPAISEKDEQAMLEFLRTKQPEVYKFVDYLRAKDTPKYQELRKDLVRETQELLKIKETKPALFELKIKDFRYGFRSTDISRRIRTASSSTNPAELEKWRQDLRDTVRRQFETRQKIREFELDEQRKLLDSAKKQFEDMQKALADREKQKSDAIEKRCQDLLAPTPQIDW